MKYRFAILTAVSTGEQATDHKQSLTDQEKHARAYGLRFGGSESGLYVLDGYSRTGYEGLQEAANDIPPLRQMLTDLEADRFDVLVMDNFDRLGDLAPMLRTRFKRVGKQIVSARQSSGILPVSLYDPYADDSTDINMHVEGIIQSYRINKLRRGWNLGIPARVEQGLHPLTVPYGYRVVTSDQPAEIVPEEAALVIRMKDWVLEGMPYLQIAQKADKILPPMRGKHWHSDVIMKMMKNEYYAGNVTFGKRKTTRNPNQDIRINQPRSRWLVVAGQHEALWDMDTARRLQAEVKRRKDRQLHWHPRYPFSGLVVCECGNKVRRGGRQQIKQYVRMYCVGTAAHYSMQYDHALEFLTGHLIKALQDYKANPPGPQDVTSLERQLEDVNTRRVRVQEGYESGLYTAEEASQRLIELETEAHELAEKISHAQELNVRRDISEDFIENLWVAIQQGDGGKVNHELSSVIDRIVINFDQSVDVHFI